VLPAVNGHHFPVVVATGVDSRLASFGPLVHFLDVSKFATCSVVSFVTRIFTELSATHNPLTPLRVKEAGP
jgi:hypothetical protein